MKEKSKNLREEVEELLHKVEVGIEPWKLLWLRLKPIKEVPTTECRNEDGIVPLKRLLDKSSVCRGGTVVSI